MLQTTAQRQGYTAARVILDSPTAVDELNNASKVIYRIRPQNYLDYVKMLSGLEPEKAALLKSTLIAFDKIDSYRILASAGVPMPQSWVIDRQAEWNTFPVVVKVPRGSKGNGVELAHNREEFEAVKESLFEGNSHLLCQEFIAESRGTDKRLIVTNRGLVTAMRRTAAGDNFRANLHQGAKAVTYTPTPFEVKIAQDALRELGLTFGGVDLIDSEAGPLVLEVNPSPGFAISEVTGVDVASQVVMSVMEGENK